MESFLADPVADSKDKMIYQSVSLEPTLKATPISQRSSGKIKPLTRKEKEKFSLLKIPKSQQQKLVYD